MLARRSTFWSTWPGSFAPGGEDVETAKRSPTVDDLFKTEPSAKPKLRGDVLLFLQIPDVR
jgi:hypothetical protein